MPKRYKMYCNVFLILVYNPLICHSNKKTRNSSGLHSLYGRFQRIFEFLLIHHFRSLYLTLSFLSRRLYLTPTGLQTFLVSKIKENLETTDSSASSVKTLCRNVPGCKVGRNILAVTTITLNGISLNKGVITLIKFALQQFSHTSYKVSIVQRRAVS